ncbi:MAG: mannose-1-phosphate guanylyltransferase [Gammaproteobacteria bacterium]|mgnify:CR=1 FL=1|nr:mannose-1-phosphate guanylyltransferase [Gammaproteobacteria bacterium]|tara:strand:+ start:16692 stop:17330 length:639 start_codon:yes stop_codon:yes gene_type:complete
MKAMILASGRGERMMPITKDLPKPMLKVGNVTLIEDKIIRLAESGVTEIIINVGYLGYQIKDFVGDGSKFGIEITLSDEGDMPIGTANGIRKILEYFDDENFIVVNSDIWTNYLYIDLNDKLINNNYAHIILVNNPNYHNGDFSLNQNYLIQGNDFTFSGIGVYNPKLFKKYNDKELGDILRKEEKITGEIYNGLWSDIGTPGRLDELRKKL